jgi:hypothetical protein
LCFAGLLRALTDPATLVAARWAWVCRRWRGAGGVVRGTMGWGMGHMMGGLLEVMYGV